MRELMLITLSNNYFSHLSLSLKTLHQGFEIYTLTIPIYNALSNTHFSSTKIISHFISFWANPYFYPLCAYLRQSWALHLRDKFSIINHLHVGKILPLRKDWIIPCPFLFFVLPCFLFCILIILFINCLFIFKLHILLKKFPNTYMGYMMNVWFLR